MIHKLSVFRIDAVRVVNVANAIIRQRACDINFMSLPTHLAW